jgi:hypothetical protein
MPYVFVARDVVGDIPAKRIRALDVAGISTRKIPHGINTLRNGVSNVDSGSHFAQTAVPYAALISTRGLIVAHRINASKKYVIVSDPVIESGSHASAVVSKN